MRRNHPRSSRSASRDITPQRWPAGSPDEPNRFSSWAAPRRASRPTRAPCLAARTCSSCHTAPRPGRCPACGSRYIKSFGIGTERIEQEVRSLFATARVVRLDRDVMKTVDAADLVFDRMVSGDADVLVGTQLVAKGLDLPRVTTVGVVNADTSLHFPDYRSSERTFSLLTQVAGRAGRGTRASQVLIQTYNPDHAAIRHAQYLDYRGFYREELEFRRT